MRVSPATGTMLTLHTCPAMSGVNENIHPNAVQDSAGHTSHPCILYQMSPPPPSIYSSSSADAVLQPAFDTGNLYFLSRNQ